MGTDQRYHRDQVPDAGRLGGHVERRGVPGGPGGRDLLLRDGQPAVGTEPQLRDVRQALPAELHPHLPQVSGEVYVHIEGIKQTLLSKASYNKYICQKKQKQQYITVGTVRMFLEPSTKH